MAVGPRITISDLPAKGIFDMLHNGLPGGGHSDGDYVDSPYGVFLFVFRKIGLSQSDEPISLSPVDALKSRFRRVSPARSDFDKYERFILLAHDVDLPMFTAPVSSQDVVTLALQMVNCQLFAKIAQFMPAHGHENCAFS
jgi:hypothetical protein